MRLLVSIAVFTCGLHASLGVADEARDVADFVVSVGEQAVENDKITGLSIGVAIGDEVLTAKGFGLTNVELSVPVTADTVYRIGSITKQFTAAAVLILVEDGKIALDAPLTKYLPDYPAHGRAVTVKHLLQHTSGVADFTRLPEYRRDRPLDIPKDEVLDRFQNLPLKFPPGEKHRYCNSGYFLLGLIVEQASGKSFREFVEDRLFKSLEMQHSYCDRSQTIIPHRAAGYSSALQAVICSGAVGNMRHPNHSKRAATVYRNLATGRNRNLSDAATDKIMRQASPSSYIRKDVPPIILVHGAKDTVVFIDSTDEFVKAMKTAGTDITYLRFDDGTHGVMGQKRSKTYPAMFKLFEQHLQAD